MQRQQCHLVRTRRIRQWLTFRWWQHSMMMRRLEATMHARRRPCASFHSERAYRVGHAACAAMTWVQAMYRRSCLQCRIYMFAKRARGYRILRHCLSLLRPVVAVCCCLRCCLLLLRLSRYLLSLQPIAVVICWCCLLLQILRRCLLQSVVAACCLGRCLLLLRPRDRAIFITLHRFARLHSPQKLQELTAADVRLQ